MDFGGNAFRGVQLEFRTCFTQFGFQLSGREHGNAEDLAWE